MEMAGLVTPVGPPTWSGCHRLQVHHNGMTTGSHESRENGPCEVASESSGFAMFPASHAPLLRLCDLIQSNLTADDRAYWDLRLQNDGYRGAFEDRLLELCLRSDLVALLCEVFTKAQLHRLLCWLKGGTDTPLFSSDHASELLRLLGFTLLEPRPSISELRLLIKQQQARLETVETRADLRGCIAEAASRIEVALRELIHFYGSVLLPDPYLKFFQSRNWITPERSFERLTLGDLFFLIESLDRYLKDSRQEDGTADLFRQLFPGRDGLLVNGAGNLQVVTRGRNRFGHYQREIDSRSLPELRVYAREFFDVLVPFVQYLEESGVFPRTITIKEFVRDNYGRTFVRAVDDLGKEEVVFTDRELDPTRQYFMYPTTNPIRLYPRLVPRS